MPVPLANHADHFLRGGRKLHNVWLHDVAERLKHRRQVLAKDQGLDPADVQSYPISGDVTIIGGGDESRGGGTLRIGLLTAAMLLTGLGLGSAPLWLPGLLNPPASPQAAPADPQEYRVTFWLEDGGEIEIER